MVKGGAGGWVEVDVLGGSGGVAADHCVTRHSGHVAAEIGWRVPGQVKSGSDAAPVVLVIRETLNVMVLHLEKKKEGKSQ